MNTRRVVQQSASSMVVSLLGGLPAERQAPSSAATEMQEASASLMLGLALLKPESRLCSAVVAYADTTHSTRGSKGIRIGFTGLLSPPLLQSWRAET